jgi:hypothetical protein
MAQIVECLPGEHEIQSSNPVWTKKRRKKTKTHKETNMLLTHEYLVIRFISKPYHAPNQLSLS